MRTIESQGVAIPKLGFGTFRLAGDDAQEVVERALQHGYRHIDTAKMYDTEVAVGAAIAASGVNRNSIFLTTKAWRDDLAPGALRQALETSLSKLKQEYVDLYMIHWPTEDMDLPKVMDTMMELRHAGLAKAIGVCNFNLAMLKQVVEDIKAPIATVQVEYHLYLDQSKLLAYLGFHGIPLTAHVPLAQGRAATDPALTTIGQKHNATAAQVALSWLLNQPSVIAIPKAKRAESQMENLRALDIELDDEDRAIIAALPKDQRYVRPALSPAWDE